jgi:hypothetical protein
MRRILTTLAVISPVLVLNPDIAVSADRLD